MSVQAQTLIQAPSKTRKPGEGHAGASCVDVPENVAAKFQSMLQSVKDNTAEEKNDVAAKGAPADSVGPDDQLNAPPTSDDATLEKTSRGNREVDYSTTNLTEALRKVSQTVMAPTNDLALLSGDEAGSLAPEEVQGGDTVSVGHATTLTLNSILSSVSVQVTDTKSSVDPGRSQTGQNLPVHNAAAWIEKSDGESGKTTIGASSLFAQFGIEPERVSDERTLRSTAVQVVPEDAADTVKVVRQETHFAPNLRLSPAQQVGDQIAFAMKELPAEIGRSQAGLTTKAEGPVLKTLDIQLTPHALGTVKVSLRMIGDTVEVQLLTSRAQTAELLKQDRRMLDQMLRTTGFNADTITIQAVDDRGFVQANSQGGSVSPQTQNSSNSGPQFDGQRNSPNGDGSKQSDPQSGNEGQEDRSQASEFTKGKGHEEVSDIRLSDGIYL